MSAVSIKKMKTLKHTRRVIPIEDAANPIKTVGNYRQGITVSDEVSYINGLERVYGEYEKNLLHSLVGDTYTPATGTAPEEIRVLRLLLKQPI